MKISRRYHSHRGKQAALRLEEHPQSSHKRKLKKKNKSKPGASNDFGWERRRARQGGCRLPRLRPRSAHPGAGPGPSSGVCEGPEGGRAGRAGFQAHARTRKFRLSSDRKENPLEERHGSFLAPTQILSAAVLHLRSLSAVLSPYHLLKSSRKGAGFFARLPQPDQEEITFDLLSQSEQEILLWPGLDEYA